MGQHKVFEFSVYQLGPSASTLSGDKPRFTAGKFVTQNIFVLFCDDDAETQKLHHIARAKSASENKSYFAEQIMQSWLEQTAL